MYTLNFRLLALREVRVALLEADVSLPVARAFVKADPENDKFAIKDKDVALEAAFSSRIVDQSYVM